MFKFQHLHIQMRELDIGMDICCFMRKWLKPKHQDQQRKPELQRNVPSMMWGRHIEKSHKFLF